MCVYRTFSELGLLIFIGMNTLIIWCSYSFQYVGRKGFFFFIFWLLISCLCDSLRRRGRSPDECDLTSSISVCKWPGGVCRCLFWYSTYFGYLVKLLCTFSPNSRRETLSLSLVDKSICVGGDRMDILTASPSSYWLLWNLRLRISSVSFLITIKTINVFVLRPLLAGHIRATTWISFCISSSSPCKRPNI